MNIHPPSQVDSSRRVSYNPQTGFKKVRCTIVIITRTIGNIRSWIIKNPAPAALWAIMAFALLMRLPCMNYCISPDEACSVEEYIRRGFKGIFLQHYHSGNHPLASFLAWAFTLILGQSDWVLQLPFLIIGTATIPLIYIAATRAFGSKSAGLSAAFMLAWSPYHVAYSANMRGYVPLIFFALAATILLQANLARATWLQTIGIALCVFLMAMSHLASLLILSAWAGVMFIYAIAGVFSKSRRNRNHWFNFFATFMGFTAAGGLIELGYSPVFSCVKAVLTRALTRQWPPELFSYLCGAEQTVWHPLERFEQTITGFSGAPFFLVAALAILGAIVPLLRRRWSAGIYALALILPIAADLAVGLKLEPRYTLTLLPFFIALFGAGLLYFAEGVAKIASYIPHSGAPFRKFIAASAYCAPLLFLNFFLISLYGDDFPYAPTRLACVFQNHKASAKYIAQYASNFDAMTYEHGFAALPDYYLQCFYYPQLKLSDQPPPVARLWHISTICLPPRYQPQIPVGSNPVLAAPFRGSSVWVSDIAPNTMKQVMLPPFSVNPAPIWKDCMAPWKWTNTNQDNLDVFFSHDIRAPNIQVIEISPRMTDTQWTLESPQYSCASGKQIVFRAEIRGRIAARSTGISVRFFDETGTEIDKWENWTPSTPTTTLPSAWKPYQLSIMAPLTAKSMTVALRARAPLYCGETFACRNLKLWLNDPAPAP
jgi:hypothetical protein